MEKEQNPIQNILVSTLSNLKNIVDVDNVVGSPITLPDKTTIIPVSKVSVGFVSGGGQYNSSDADKMPDYPFSGGSGSGYCISPLGFISVRAGEVKMISVDGKSGFDKLLSTIPSIISSIGEAKNGKDK